MSPLEGIRVIDLSRILAGPWCTQLLGDLGAEVIKVEHPLRGDDTRQWGPPWLRDRQGDATAESSYYLSANRNKSSLALDISRPEGQAVMRRLVAGSDIFIENFKVGGLAKYGLDYASLKAVNPGLIYVSITGFGQTGPMAKQPGYDYLIQGLGGLMSITGQPEDVPGGGPQRVGVAISDITTGLYAAIGILAALHHRDGTGEGQYIDLALLDTQVGWLANQASNYLTGGVVPGLTGKWHPNLAPYQPFRTADADIILAVGNDTQFTSLARFIGRPELASDPRFDTNPHRNANREALEAELQRGVRETSEGLLAGAPSARGRSGLGDQQYCRCLRDAAGQVERSADRTGSSAVGSCVRGRQSTPVLRDAGELPRCGTAAWGGYRQGVARSAGYGRCGDRTPAR